MIKWFKFNINLNIDETINSEIYKQLLYDLKHLIVKKLLNKLDEYLLNNSTLNDLNSINYLQLLLTLTIDILVYPNECEQYIDLLLTAAKQLDKSNVINYYL
ncbi:unnamed protein product [Rotaria sp. Silwood1]|nr:unnamed protein product [Rotaria sp. Silwood1]CAF1638129.1 unnamed protein product [Rotaria sp. Silwood1]